MTPAVNKDALLIVGSSSPAVFASRFFAFARFFIMALFLLQALPHCAAAQDHSPNAREALRELQKRSKSTKSIDADFIQEKHLSFMNETLFSTGRFAFRAPREILWEYKTPASAGLHYVDGKISILGQASGNAPDGAKGGKPAGAGRAAAIMAENVLRWTSPNPELLLAAFKITVVEQEPLRLLLEPRILRDDSPIRSLELFFGADGVSMSRIILREPDDDYTRITFSNTRLERQDAP